ncbi:MAG: DUF2085 domain-containing protein [Rhodothermales bacterium]|nr:DUF2085 domain-containing protein [Rhodothermales bacterium]
MKSVLTHTNARHGWLIAAGACALVLVLALLPPVLPEGLRAGMMHAFASVCHQLPHRSFAPGGVPLAVCHRCTGLLAGLVLGTMLLPFVWGRARRFARYDVPLLVLAGLPALLDWGLSVVGVWTNTPTTRFATGLLFGVAAGYLFARMLATDPARRSAGAAAG